MEIIILHILAITLFSLSALHAYKIKNYKTAMYYSFALGICLMLLFNQIF
jgi:hypothetical protein